MHKELLYSQKLEGVGFTRKQAETQVEILTAVVGAEMVTRLDFEKTTLSIRAEISALRTDMQHMESSLRTEMKHMDYSLRADMKQMETSLRADLHKLEGAMLAGFAKIGQDMKLLKANMIITTGLMLVGGIGLLAKLSHWPFH